MFVLLTLLPVVLGQSGGFSGTYAGQVAILSVDREVVESWLPPELELAPQSITPHSRHPVALLMLNESTAPGHGFNEVTLEVMATRLKGPLNCGGPTEFNYLTISFFDNAQSVTLGRLLFGLNAYLMSVTPLPSSWTANSADPLMPFSLMASFGSDAVLNQPGQARFDDVAPLLSQPVLAHNGSGPLTWHQIDWKFPEATIQSRAIDLDASWALAGMCHVEDAIPGLNNNKRGAFYVAGPFDSTLGTVCTP
jgi:hypothetical protein